MLTGKEAQDMAMPTITKTGGASQFDFDELFLERLQQEVNIAMVTCLDYRDYNYLS